MPIKNSKYLENLRRQYKEGKLNNLSHKEACCLVSCKPSRNLLEEICKKEGFSVERIERFKKLYKKFELWLYQGNFNFARNTKILVVLYLGSRIIEGEVLTWRECDRLIHEKQDSHSSYGSYGFGLVGLSKAFLKTLNYYNWRSVYYKKKEKKNTERQKILKLLKENSGEISNEGLSKGTGIKKSNIPREIKKLEDKGYSISKRYEQVGSAKYVYFKLTNSQDSRKCSREVLTKVDTPLKELGYKQKEGE